MATYNEIAYDLLETITNNQISDDTDISIEHILFHYNSQREVWLRNEYNKPGRLIDPQVEQDLQCLELEEADSADCCSIKTGCTILRTKKIIPKLVEFHHKSAITRIGPVSKIKIPFNFDTYNKAILASYNKYAKGVFAFLMNQRIYLMITDPKYKYIDYINIRAVLSNPMDVKNFDCETSCFSYDNEYPLNTWMLPFIKNEVLKQYGISLNIPKDDTNDSNDNNKK